MVNQKKLITHEGKIRISSNTFNRSKTKDCCLLREHHHMSYHLIEVPWDVLRVGALGGLQYTKFPPFFLGGGLESDFYFPQNSPPPSDENEIIKTGSIM